MDHDRYVKGTTTDHDIHIIPITDPIKVDVMTPVWIEPYK